MDVPLWALLVTSLASVTAAALAVYGTIASAKATAKAQKNITFNKWRIEQRSAAYMGAVEMLDTMYEVLVRKEAVSDERREELRLKRNAVGTGLALHGTPALLHAFTQYNEAYVTGQSALRAGDLKAVDRALDEMNARLHSVQAQMRAHLDKLEA